MANEKKSCIPTGIINIIKRVAQVATLVVFFAAVFFLYAVPAQASVLSLSPASGTFTVGGTFTVSVLLNTENDTVNTIGTTISYPPDKLQLVSPSTGNSIISIWTTLPKVDNSKGLLELQGGIPGGIKSSGAAVTTLTFRVNSVGLAVVKFTDASKVLLHDGLGTNSLRQVTNGVYNLILPPPAGPIVSSETHPDQSRWYPMPTVVLRWAAEENVDGYSYVLSDSPSDVPDDISDGIKQAVTYKNLNDGVHFFHIKSIKDGSWGGTTHFAIKIDATSPAQFPVEIIPDARTSRRTPIVQFSTTDASSGLGHYEIKLIPLFASQDQVSGSSQPLFIEITSPYVFPELAVGNYDVIVRAFDIAGNYREVTTRLSIVNPLFTIIRAEGIRIGGVYTLAWMWVWIVLFIVTLIAFVIAWRVRAWHHRVLEQRLNKKLPDKVQQDLDELHKFRSKYGKLACLVLFVCLFLAHSVKAQTLAVTPPLIETISSAITNEDIFYVGGKTDTAGANIILYLQNQSTGETITEVVLADNRGEWFYRHSGFLSSGNYLLWTQTKIGNELSPPGPQEKIMVRTNAIHLGTSRLSIETIYFGITALAILAFVILVLFTIVHLRRGRRHNQELQKEIRAAEESIRRGFALLRRDIQEELSIVHKIKMEKSLSDEEKQKEEQLLKDLETAEQTIGQEIWQIDHLQSK